MQHAEKQPDHINVNTSCILNKFGNFLQSKGDQIDQTDQLRIPIVFVNTRHKNI